MVRDAADFRHRDLGFGPDGQPNPWYYEMQALGWNYRITDFACALGEGMRTLKQDGMEKVLLGMTDMAQVRAVCIK